MTDETVEVSKETLHSVIQMVHDLREQQRKDRHALARENHELQERAQKNERALEYAYNQIDTLRDEVTGLQEQVENSEKTVVATDGGENSALEPRVSDLEDGQQRAEESRGHIIEDLVDIEERVEEVEETSSRSAEDGDLENTLPIQQTTRIWKVGGTIKTNKTEHAAAIWSDFMDRAKKGRGIRYLDTGRVKSILREHFRNDDRHEGVTEHIERSTIHRAMDTVIEMAGNLVSKNTIKNGRSALIINDQEFREFCEVIGATETDGVTNDVTADEGGNVTRAT